MFTKNAINILISFSFLINFNAQTLVDQWVKVNKTGCKVLDPYYSKEVTQTWEGECADGKADGYGVLKKYSNGKLESIYEGDYKNGIRAGKGKFTHIEMKSVLECTFVDGQAVGKGVYYFEGGTKYVGDILNYRRHGEGILYYADGTKMEGFTVSDDFYTGKTTYPDDTYKYTQQYATVDSIQEPPISDYKPDFGVEIKEYLNGKRQRCEQEDASFYRLVTYISDNKPAGLVKEYYISGSLYAEFKAIYLDYEDEWKNFTEGDFVEYYENGNIKEKYFCFNNHVIGKYKCYYENGQIKSETNYKNGYKNGEYKEWYPSGKLKKLALFTDGQLEKGKYLLFDEKGVGVVVFNENFKKNYSKWAFYYEDNSSEVNRDNQLEISVGPGYQSVRYNEILIDQENNYSIESTVFKKQGDDQAGYGIVFGFKDWDNYFTFLITGNGSYKLINHAEGFTVDIVAWTYSEHINTGDARNSLKIEKIDNYFTYYINGELVMRDYFSESKSDKVGVYTCSAGEYVLENITVVEYSKVKKRRWRKESFGGRG